MNKPKNFRVHFFRVKVGNDGYRLADVFSSVTYGQKLGNVAKVALLGRAYQIRDLTYVAPQKVWLGAFYLLRDDAPNKITTKDIEESLDLAPGDSLAEKCHFRYDESLDILTWQLNTTCCWPAKLAEYLSNVCKKEVHMLPILDADSMKRVANGQIKSFQMKVANPPSFPPGTPSWNRHTFDLLKSMDGTDLRVEVNSRSGKLSKDAALQALAWAQSNKYTKSLKACLVDESEPIDLLANRISGRISVELIGRYPIREKVLAALQAEYESHLVELKRALKAMG